VILDSDIKKSCAGPIVIKGNNGVWVCSRYIGGNKGAPHINGGLEVENWGGSKAQDR